MNDHDLSCDHNEGRDQLFDRLSTGELSSDEQRILWHISQRMVDLPTEFRIDDVEDYETQPDGDETYIEYWTCPVCGISNSDTRDNRTIEET